MRACGSRLFDLDDFKSTASVAVVHQWHSRLVEAARARKGMERAIVNRLNAEFAKVVQVPEIRNVYERIGADPLTLSPQAFEQSTLAEIAKLGPVVKASGAKVD